MAPMRWAITLLLASLASGAAAQSTVLEPSAAVRCATPLPGSAQGPDYPFFQFKVRRSGRVKVALEFKAADKPPAVTVLEHEGDDEFVDAVRQHVRSLRVPCLGEGMTAQLWREYVFTPDQRDVDWGELQDADDDRRKRELACMVHVSGRKTPEYPRWAQRDEVQGRVVASLRFDAADQPPQVQILARPTVWRLAEDVERWVQGLRLPCMTAGPITVTQNYIWVFEGSAYGFKPLTLQQLLGRVKGISGQTLQFDTTEMGCPFELRLLYLQPLRRNEVGVVGKRHPGRAPLLQWLAGIELDLPRGSLDAVFADTAPIHVPCLKIDLKPKEKQT